VTLYTRVTLSRFYPRSWRIVISRYADVAGMWIPILSSVSLTSESSASVRSSKGKLQLEEIRPIERTQRERRERIVIVSRSFADDKFVVSSSSLSVGMDRSSGICRMRFRCPSTASRQTRKREIESSKSFVPALDGALDAFSAVRICVRLSVCKMLSFVVLYPRAVSVLRVGGSRTTMLMV